LCVGRLPAGSVYHYLTEIFVLRSAALWNREEVHQWLVNSALVVSEYSQLEKAASLQQKMFESLSSRQELQKYLSAATEDFQEDFPRFPPEANPLDPRFADPRLLARQLLPRQQARGAAGLDNVMEGANRRRRNRGDNIQERIMLPDGRINQEALIAELERLHEQGIDITPEEFLAQIQQFGAGAGDAIRVPGQEGALTAGINVDLDAPLMQLFLQTMMPWYQVPPPQPGNPNNGNHDN
jgi:hypothetical protein